MTKILRKKAYYLRVRNTKGIFNLAAHLTRRKQTLKNVKSTHIAISDTVYQLQTYLAWLLKDETLEITPMIETPPECKFSDIVSATFEDPDFESDKNQSLSGKSEEGNQQRTEISTKTASSWLNMKVIKELLPKLMKEGSSLA